MINVEFVYRNGDGYTQYETFELPCVPHIGEDVSLVPHGDNLSVQLRVLAVDWFIKNHCSGAIVHCVLRDA